MRNANVIKGMFSVVLATLAIGISEPQSSDAVKMGLPVMTVPDAPRVAKLVRMGTASDLQSGTVLQIGDQIDNISGADVDVMIRGLGMVRVKPHSTVSFAATPKPNAKLMVNLERGRMMCWVEFDPTQYRFLATAGPVSVEAATGRGTSFLVQTTRQPLKQPNYVTVLVGKGGAKVTLDDPNSGAYVLDGQIIKVDPRNAVGQPGKPDDYERRDLRELRNGPY